MAVRTLVEARAKGAQPDGWFETPIGRKQGPIAGQTRTGVTYCSELLPNNTERLRDEEGSGGAGQGPRSPLGCAAGPSGLR
ncbi:hypothetical protein NDU88_002601 [Pleurodeles waltl]|uniref:Uncharacterized protein n=1 Tax=Pleurodeles waltl TaxID=8319 RepID=A0AAV7MW86_PLEWA|nr:hypothetical protein NDU88_002601 [Pleurodeles waltl]